MVNKSFVIAAIAAIATSVAAQSCGNLNGQCGGKVFAGSSCCATGLTCKYVSEWYSQCVTDTTPSPATSPASSPATSPGVSSGCAYTAPTGSTTSSGNPYEGVPRYVSAAYAAKVDTSIAKYSSNSTRVALLNAVKRYPTFTWMDNMAALDTLSGHLQAAGAQGNGKTIVAEFVIYDLPGRDCAARSSNGEIPKGGIETYKSQYIDRAVSIFKTKPSNVRLVLVVEPDSLPNLATNIGQLRCDSTTQTEYPAAVAYAIAKLSALPDTYLYLDAAHGGWLGWPDNQQKIVPIFQNVLTLAKQINSAATIRGFASAVANYSPFQGNGDCPAREKCPLQNGKYDYNDCIDENLYTLALNKVFSSASLPTRWLIDTSRSGQHTIRKYWGSWCNAKGAGIGDLPKTNPAAQVDALVWVKPPGDSDGTSDTTATRFDGNCDPNDATVSLGASGIDALSDAPEAGAWFDKQFIMLVDNASPKITPASGSQTCGGTVTSPIVTSPPTSPIVNSPSPAVTSPATSPVTSPVGTGGACGPYTAPAGLTTSSGNPYEGVPRYVSAAYAAKVDTSIAKYSSNSTRVALLNAVKRYPTFTWMDNMAALDTLSGHLQAAGAQGNGNTIVAEFVIYDLPGRDCAARSSNGEIPKGGIETYKSQYIDRAVSIFKNKPSNVRLVLVVEPDSLPNLATNIGQLRCDSTTQTEYPAAVAYAIAKLSALPDTYLYLDAAHG
ncbi:hypothetical protein HK098_007046, partial [Nowakowskiella sp. JEL0407]